MLDLIELRNWCFAFLLCLAILAFVAGLVWLCLSYPLGVLWAVVLCFIVIYAKGGTL